MLNLVILMDNKEMITAKRLKQCRIQSKRTLDQIGNLVGVHKTTVMRWEKGETERIGLPTIQKLAHFYGVNPAWLMGADVNMNEEPEIISPDPDDILTKYYSLDTEDRSEIRGIIKYMLRNEKYAVKKPYTLKRAARSGNPETDDTLTEEEIKILKYGKRLPADSDL